MYNVICACCFLFVILLSHFLEKIKHTEIILRIISIVITIDKLANYIIQNIHGNIAIPVEISTLTYFLMCIILTFKIKSLYCVGSFYGIMAGLGYYLFYSILGFTVRNDFIIRDIVIGCFTHGFLLISGIHIFRTHYFKEEEKLRIWITIFAMLSWSLVFYDVQMRGITFIYYIIKPTYLFIFQAMSLNFILIMLYYALLVTAFYFVIKIFFRINNNQYNKVQSAINTIK